MLKPESALVKPRFDPVKSYSGCQGPYVTAGMIGSTNFFQDALTLVVWGLVLTDLREPLFNKV